MFLLKPHVTGPEGQITTPDVVVDRLLVDGKGRSLGLLTHDCWQEVEADASSCPAYALMALGGGALILPAQVMSSGMVIAARSAWRLNNPRWPCRRSDVERHSAIRPGTAFGPGCRRRWRRRHPAARLHAGADSGRCGNRGYPRRSGLGQGAAPCCAFAVAGCRPLGRRETQATIFRGADAERGAAFHLTGWRNVRGRLGLCRGWGRNRRLRAGESSERRSLQPGASARSWGPEPESMDPCADRIFQDHRRPALRLVPADRSGTAPERAPPRLAAR